MAVECTGRNVEITASVRELAEERTHRLERHLGGPADVRVVLSHEKHRYGAEILAIHRRRRWKAQEETGDPRAAVALAFENLGRVGIVEKARIIEPNRIEAGDALVGLPSSGLHTNGFSLVRYLFREESYQDVVPELGRPLADELLEPHRSYLAELRPIETEGIAAPELVQVDAVHHLNPVARAQPISSTIASRTLSGSTRSPSRGSPGADRSTKRTPPASRFLSRPRASRIASGSTSPSIWVGRPARSSIARTCARSSSASESRSAANSPSPTASPWR